jgi:hypothetical protein
MARNKTNKNEWVSFETKTPDDGQRVTVKYLDGEEKVLVYADERVNFEEGTVWKLAETEPIETEPVETEPVETEAGKGKSKVLALTVTQDDLHRYIADGLKADSGVTVLDMWTNADNAAFIVYGSGLGRVQS